MGVIFCHKNRFFCWKLHGSTKFVVRAVALLSAKRSEKESSKMIMGFNNLCMLSNNKNLKKHGTNRGKERRQPHRGCLKQQHRGKPARTSETDGRAVASGVSDTLDSIGVAADDVGTHVDTSLHVRLALQGQTPDIPKPIWETGIWGVIFGQDDFLEAYKTFGSECKGPTVFPDRSHETQMASSSAKKQKVSKGYASVVKFKQDIAWQEQQDAFFQSALKLWYIVVCRWDEACAFHIQLHDLYMEEGALQMLSDIFSGKESLGCHEDVRLR